MRTLSLLLAVCLAGAEPAAAASRAFTPRSILAAPAWSAKLAPAALVAGPASLPGALDSIGLPGAQVPSVAARAEAGSPAGKSVDPLATSPAAAPSGWPAAAIPAAARPIASVAAAIFPEAPSGAALQPLSQRLDASFDGSGASRPTGPSGDPVNGASGAPQGPAAPQLDPNAEREVVLVTLADPGPGAALDAKLAEFEAAYGFYRDYGLEPIRQDGIPMVTVRGSVPKEQRGWLRLAKGVLFVDAAAGTKPSEIARAPYRKPPFESLLRRALRGTFEASELGALTLSLPFALAIYPALFGPLIVANAALALGGVFGPALMGAAVSNLLTLSPFDALVTWIPHQARIAIGAGFAVVASSALIAAGHPLFGVAALVNAVLSARALMVFVGTKHSSKHPTDQFVNGMEANLLFSALGANLIALGWAFTRPELAPWLLAGAALILTLAALPLRRAPKP